MFLGTMLAGCSADRTGPAIADQHLNADQRMYNIGARFEEDRHKGGMAEGIADVDSCYQSATLIVTKVFVLRDYLILDYVGLKTDQAIGLKLNGGQSLPYFEPKLATARWARYGKAAEFNSPQRLAAYLQNGSQAVMIYDKQQLHAAPVIGIHPLFNHLGASPFAGDPF